MPSKEGPGPEVLVHTLPSDPGHGSQLGMLVLGCCADHAEDFHRHSHSRVFHVIH